MSNVQPNSLFKIITITMKQQINTN